MSYRLGLLTATVLVILGALGSGRLWAGAVYWTDKEDFTIRRGDMDGSGPPVVLLTPADGLGIPQGIGLDPAAGKMYFADSFYDKIQRGLDPNMIL